MPLIFENNVKKATVWLHERANKNGEENSSPQKAPLQNEVKQISADRFRADGYISVLLTALLLFYFCILSYKHSYRSAYNKGCYTCECFKVEAEAVREHSIQ